MSQRGWYNSGWKKNLHFYSSIIKIIMLYSFYSYKELSNDIILLELHKATKGVVVTHISRFRPAKWLSKVIVRSGGNSGCIWPIIWLIQEHGSHRDFSAWIFITRAGHWHKWKYTLLSDLCPRLHLGPDGSYVHICLHSSGHISSYSTGGEDR